GIRDRNVTGVQTCALPIAGDKKHHRHTIGEKASADGGKNHERDDQHGTSCVECNGSSGGNQSHEDGVQAPCADASDTGVAGIEGRGSQTRHGGQEESSIDGGYSQHDEAIAGIGKSNQVQVTDEHYVNI